MGTRPALEVEDTYRALLRESRSRDRAAGRTLEGPHLCDLIVTHGPKNLPAARCSTGEQKSLLVGLSLSHVSLVAAMQGLAPVVCWTMWWPIWMANGAGPVPGTGKARRAGLHDRRRPLSLRGAGGRGTFRGEPRRGASRAAVIKPHVCGRTFLRLLGFCRGVSVRPPLGNLPHVNHDALTIRSPAGDTWPATAGILPKSAAALRSRSPLALGRARPPALRRHWRRRPPCTARCPASPSRSTGWT